MLTSRSVSLCGVKFSNLKVKYFHENEFLRKTILAPMGSIHEKIEVENRETLLL